MTSPRSTKATADTSLAGRGPITSRRSFLAASGVGLAAASTVAVTGLGTRLALAAPNDQGGDAIVVVFLRGGADGLSMAPPYGYSSYRQLRPTIAVSPPGTAGGALPLTGDNPNVVFPTGLDGVVGLHPAMKPLYDALWPQGRLAVIPAAGLPASESASRSHFSATRYVETGSASGAVGGGWLGRMVNQGAPGATIPAVDTSTRSGLLDGGSGAIAIPRLSSFGLNGFRNRDRAEAALRNLYSGPDSVSAKGTSVLNVVDQIDAIDTSARPGYPDTGLGRTFNELAILLGGNFGIRGAAIDFGGWDHHSNHGPVGNGRFHDKATELAGALAAFANDTNGLQGITVVVITEFGRTTNENGNRGTDHGRAATHLAMGAGVQGGVFGDDYPDEISSTAQPRRALPVVTDYRKPLAEIVTKRGGVGDLGVVFPTYQHGGDLGLARG